MKFVPSITSIPHKLMTAQRASPINTRPISTVQAWREYSEIRYLNLRDNGTGATISRFLTHEFPQQSSHRSSSETNSPQLPTSRPNTLKSHGYGWVFMRLQCSVVVLVRLSLIISWRFIFTGVNSRLISKGIHRSVQNRAAMCVKHCEESDVTRIKARKEL